LPEQTRPCFKTAVFVICQRLLWRVIVVAFTAQAEPAVQANPKNIGFKIGLPSFTVRVCCRASFRVAADSGEQLQLGFSNISGRWESENPNSSVSLNEADVQFLLLAIRFGIN